MKFTAPSEPNFGRKAGLDPKDFIFSKKQKETLIKNPSQIHGQQFIIEECEGCEIFLLDHVGSLTVDFCKDCRIVTGPVSSRSIILILKQSYCSRIPCIVYSFEIVRIVLLLQRASNCDFVIAQVCVSA